MSKKVIVLNGSPRKDFNTAKMLKEAQKGAESANAEVEFVNLYDYNFKGCMSCFSWQRKGSTTNGVCAIKDELRPILEKCIAADAIVIGTPVYFSYPTGMFRCFVERLMFPNFTYLLDKATGGLKRGLDRTIPTGVIFTMNCPEEMANAMNYKAILEENTAALNRIMGYAESLYCYDTTQFDDFSKYNCDLFSEEQKKKTRETQFPQDMQKAFDLGKKLTLM